MAPEAPVASASAPVVGPSPASSAARGAPPREVGPCVVRISRNRLIWETSQGQKQMKQLRAEFDRKQASILTEERKLTAEQKAAENTPAGPKQDALVVQLTAKIRELEQRILLEQRGLADKEIAMTLALLKEFSPHIIQSAQDRGCAAVYDEIELLWVHPEFANKVSPDAKSQDITDDVLKRLRAQ